LLPYLEFLRKIGAPVERGLRQAKLPTMVVDRPDAYLPQLLTLAFLAAMSKSEGIDELGLRALQRLSISDFSERFVAAVNCRSPALWAALENFRTLAPVEDPFLHFWTLSGINTVKLCSSYRYPLDAQVQPIQDWSGIMALVQIVRAFAGPTWQPQEMAFTSHTPLGRFASEQFPNTRFLTGQQSAWISVPRELLTLPPRGKLLAAGAPSASGSEQATGAEPKPDLPASLKQVLAAYLPDGYPPIELAAEIAGTSVRTLQRRLDKSQVTYSDLIQQARFEAASKLLCDTDTKAIDIAYEVGYADPSHFTRAFRRIAAMSPREYRRQYRPD
jgi:AraC-like DNA-binding protein